jgi:exopolysaccharide biosynthesis protein
MKNSRIREKESEMSQNQIQQNGPENEQNRDTNEGRRQPELWSPIRIILTDLLALVLCLLTFAVYYFTPQTYAGTETASGNAQTGVVAVSAPEMAEEPSKVEIGDFSMTFEGKFTDGEVIVTEDSYRSADINVTLTKVEEDGVTYYLQDIYVRNIRNIQSAFANDTYGKAVTAPVLDMAISNQAVGAINGDYYGVENSGVVIRNGILYRGEADSDVLVLYLDGTMKVIDEKEFQADTAMAEGAYQAWCFGPSLMQDGEAIESFRSSISGVNPRTMIGYFEPGHYGFVTVDGRQKGYSVGMTLVQLAELGEYLGFVEAYNLDGGKTSTMTFGDHIANQPVSGGRKTSDIIFITELEETP